MPWDYGITMSNNNNRSNKLSVCLSVWFSYITRPKGDVLEEMIYDMPIRNFQKLVDETVVLISAILKNYFSHFWYQPKLGKVET